MLPSFVITFRETLEAALIVGIALSYLARTHQKRYNAAVYAGVGAGVVGSVIVAMLFSWLAGGFTGRAEEIFEGLTMLVGALLLTSMLLWMLRRQDVAQEVEGRVAAQETGLGLFSLVAVSVLREGIETVIFLGAARAASSETDVLGAVLGIFVAVLCGTLLVFGARKVPVKAFFRLTSVLLVLFAAGLVAQGVHELQEAHVLPTVVEHVWDINPAPNADGSYPLLHESGYLGGIGKSLLGYNGNPSLFEVLAYVGYAAMVGLVWRWPRPATAGRSPQLGAQPPK